MITRKIIKRILPNALPLAFGFAIIASPWGSLAQENIDLIIPTADSAVDSSLNIPKDSTKKPSKSTKSSTKKSADDKTKPVILSDEELTQVTNPTNSDSRVKELEYNESNVYVIRTKYGYQTNIVFDPKEEVQTISVGDRSLWQIIPAGNRLFIRPMTENISTNMTLLSNKRSYEFDLKSVSEKNDSNVYVVRFTYPEKNNAMAAVPMYDTMPTAEYVPVQSSSPFDNKKNASKTPSAITTVDKPIGSQAVSSESIGLLPIRFNYSYTYAGPDDIAPTQVYDDGKNTFIKYKSIGKSVPNAFIINANGTESPITSTIQGSSLIIDGIASELALRSSDGEIRVYNESLSGR